MFGKKTKQSQGTTLIGEGSEFEGTLRVSDGLQVDGTVDGTIEVEGGLSVGPDGILRGDIRADLASVAGTIEGTLVIDGHLHLLPTGKLEGNISYGSLQVERGGELSGRTSSPGTAVAQLTEMASHDDDEEEEMMEQVVVEL